ncbi:type II toxin-antitoxin system PrlF family antitoxin [Ottowia testudinis]|uniref:Type II toxin-antitoxin system PrlF family antitoxin n=1 Tax=Ottowia testudinis TaxID=2816950 RepID=A0A975H2B3_9BURK|nr:type II toxin-antitoxin system PrlF family antitoxin [Ottowia testudinis]QTD43995.1 type II toxin-antitoxin system PrlF family antitoxin [Ottowia testudinis]
MPYTLTSKSQVTVPKAVRKALGVGPGESVDYEVQTDGRVLMFPVKSQARQSENPFLKWVGTGVSGMTTEEILNETRGEGWNR